MVEKRARNAGPLDDLIDVSAVEGALREQFDPDSHQFLPALLGLESAARIGRIRGAHADETTAGWSTRPVRRSAWRVTIIAARDAF